MEDIKTVMSWLEGLTWDDWHEYHSDSEVQNIAKSALELLKEQKKIVRCKDCKLQECEGRNGMIVCDITGESHRPDWFCADGEPK